MLLKYVHQLLKTSHLFGCRILLKKEVVWQLACIASLDYFSYRNVFINNCVFVCCPLWKLKYDSKSFFYYLILCWPLVVFRCTGYYFCLSVPLTWLNFLFSKQIHAWYEWEQPKTLKKVGIINSTDKGMIHLGGSWVVVPCWNVLSYGTMSSLQGRDTFKEKLCRSGF